MLTVGWGEGERIKMQPGGRPKGKQELRRNRRPAEPSETRETESWGAGKVKPPGEIQGQHGTRRKRSRSWLPVPISTEAGVRSLAPTSKTTIIREAQVLPDISPCTVAISWRKTLIGSSTLGGERRHNDPQLQHLLQAASVLYSALKRALLPQSRVPRGHVWFLTQGRALRFHTSGRQGCRRKFHQIQGGSSNEDSRRC